MGARGLLVEHALHQVVQFAKGHAAAHEGRVQQCGAHGLPPDWYLNAANSENAVRAIP